MPENKAPEAPEIMWLQIENALSEYEFTHCAEKINDDDIKCIRTTASDSALKAAGLMRVPVGTGKYGCYVDGDDSTHIYEDCVIDSGDYEQCRYAHMGISKEDCKYWREVK